MDEAACQLCEMAGSDGEPRVSWFSKVGGEVDKRGSVHLRCVVAETPVWRGASLEYVSDSANPVRYALDQIAAGILDARRTHPEADVNVDMPARDRAQAVALLRMVLEVLDG